MNWEPFYITFKLAILTTIILFVVALPIGYFLAFSRWKGKIILESLVMMPIILPPTVIGFYFLSFLGPDSSVGRFFQDTLGVSFAFSFEGILLGSVIFCLPFMVTPIANGFRSLPNTMIESTYVLRKSRLNALWHVYLPCIKGSLWSGILLTFAHTIGEFGLVLMIGGKMKETQVASIAIYDEMNNLNYATAHQYAIVMLAFSFVTVVILTILSRKNRSNIA